MTLPKMAYFIHVDWNWIKQRPHFLFEELTQHYSIDLVYINRLLYNNKIKNEMNIKGEATINELLKLPFSSRYQLIHWIEKIVNSRIFMQGNNYEYIWITSPILMQFIPSDYLDNKIVIYDCMDDYLAFDVNKKNYEQNMKYEIDLLRKSKYVITSSDYLKQKLLDFYSHVLTVDPICVNNGISDAFLNKKPDVQQDLFSKENINIMYIGTVADWIDFTLLIQLLERFSNITITLVGPVDTKVPTHTRMVVKGPIPHHLLHKCAEEADAFIMPFKLTELIQAVNPVKMYEYLSFNKPVISIRYSEMDQFSPFVMLYSTGEELFNIVAKIRSFTIDIHIKQEIHEFLKRNTWRERAIKIKNTISY